MNEDLTPEEVKLLAWLDKHPGRISVVRAAGETGIPESVVQELLDAMAGQP